MTNLTEKEGLFLKSLFDDYFERGTKSFLCVLFQSKFIHKDDAKKLALSMFELEENRLFIKRSICFLELENGHIVGKKGDFFFSTCDYREIISLGRNIQDIPYYLNFNDMNFYLENGGDLKNTQYHIYLKDYIDFCAEHDLPYCTHVKHDFNQDLFILDKEEVIFDELFDEEV